ncbi:hypothetical protein BT63DRAFT_482639 [Microthyrium microscopicum]|uniref:Cytochrome c oxidase assembly protein PET191 n=1 Tax=Microthyrium microscopicum TaxID=703497 RepID=A0A6A6U1E2_9PEZI|nr:hypothetical protein BT63DRAFT_482639 [Microthyrium microscopicum]
MPSCQEIRDALAQCLSESDCVMKGNKPGDCLRPPLVDTLSDECRALKYTYGVCKRNLIDMRKRFRGPMPVTYKSKGEEPTQMYSSIGHKKEEKPAGEE